MYDVYSEVNRVYRKWRITWRGRRQLQWRHQRQRQQRQTTSHTYQLYRVADGRTGTSFHQRSLPGCLCPRNARQKTWSRRVPHSGLSVLTYVNNLISASRIIKYIKKHNEYIKQRNKKKQATCGSLCWLPLLKSYISVMYICVFKGKWYRYKTKKNDKYRKKELDS